MWLRLETEEGRDGSGLHPGLPSWLCPTHWGVEGKLGATVLITRNHVSHTQTATRRSGSTCPGKEHFPGQELTWGSCPRSLLGQASHVWVGLRAPEAKAELRRMEKTEVLEEKESEGGERGADSRRQHKVIKPQVSCVAAMSLTASQPLISAHLEQCRCHLGRRQEPKLRVG